MKKLAISLAVAGSCFGVGCGAESSGEVAPEGNEEVGAVGEALQGGSQGFALASTAGGVTAPFVFNSSGGAVTAVTGGVGVATVTFDGIGGAVPNAQVVAFGSGNARCRLVSFGSIGANGTVSVACSTPTGTPVHSAFVVHYSRKSVNNGPSAYFLNVSDTASSIPPASTSFNSTGGTNSVTRTGTGTYVALLPGLTAFAGSLQVSVFGGTGQHCKVTSFNGGGSGQTVNVACFGTTGLPANAKFSLNYAGDTNVPVFGRGAYAFASLPTTASYAPSASFSWNSTVQECNGSHFLNVATRSLIGTYRMKHPNMGSSGSAAFVTAAGAGASYCKVTSWGADGAGGVNVNTRCFNGTGTQADSQYLETFATGPILFPC